MRKKLVAGNWKMHGGIEQNSSLLSKVIAGTLGADKATFAVCVPYPYLSQVSSLLKDTQISWGAQNISQHVNGAFTGEVSATMLNDFCCHYVIVGHSERRTLYGEDSKIVSYKFKVALDAGLIPILCVGESLDEREAGITEQIVGAQLDVIIELVGVDALAHAVLAYEPIWAIGTGKTATPQQAQDVHTFIRNKISIHNAEIAAKVQILYGGSVKANNAIELFSMPDIDGGLIGGASLLPDDFISICMAANN
tara:strand:+ start:939 stop:1694 length:756 start_codon:yes stop_codon:yes gene_type:complete